VSKRVSPTERVRAEIHALFASERDLASILEDVAWLTVRLMMQTAIEAEVDEFLGRGRYKRRHDEDRPGSRNRRQPPTTVKTTMGPVELQRPKLAHSSGWGLAGRNAVYGVAFSPDGRWLVTGTVGNGRCCGRHAYLPTLASARVAPGPGGSPPEARASSRWPVRTATVLGDRTGGYR
jgi:hypothetical protein